MKDQASVQRCIADLQSANNALALMEHQPQEADATLIEVGRILEARAHVAVVESAKLLAQHNVPGAAIFLDVYSRIVQEFMTEFMTLPHDLTGFQPILTNEERAKHFRPVALFVLASFLTQLTVTTQPDLSVGTIAGGPERRDPAHAFFDLIRKVHPRREAIREVILTDPYILVDVGEGGGAGGYDGTIAYLKALGLGHSDNFVLKITPAPKRSSSAAFELFERCLTNAFPKATLARFANRCEFHDRFYLTRYARGEPRGVFGPSLNGLSSSAVVMIGAISTADLKVLFRWL